MMRKRFPLLTMILTLCLTVLFAALPYYTSKQLKDPDFVQSEIQKYTKIRQSLQKKLSSAGEIQKLAVRNNLQNAESILEALRYVEANGYIPNDAERRKLAYFRSRSVHSLASSSTPEEESPDETVYEISEKGLVPPVPLDTPAVEVPPELVGDGLRGVIKLSCVIDETGFPSQLTILEGISKEVDDLCIKTLLEKWRYKPGTLDGKSIKVRYNIAIPFNLNPPSRAQPEATDAT